MTKARTKAQKRRDARKRFEELAARSAQTKSQMLRVEISTAAPQFDRPTPERLAKGKWHEPGKAAPVTDMHADMIGRLYDERKISHSQHEAARLFQELRQDYVAELCVRGYGSCLDISLGGYDASDGNAEAVRAYERLRARIGHGACMVLVLETGKGPDGRPANLDALAVALDRVNGG